MDRSEAYALLTEKLAADNLIKHSLATEAIMRALARRFGEDEELWGMTGLLHDLDLEIVGDDMSTHAQVTADILLEAGFPQEGVQAVRMHNSEGLGLGERTSRFEHSLAAAETVTGLIVATALVLPSKSLADVKAKSVRKRMKETAFARGARREVIMECEEAGVPLDEFIDLSLEAMRGIAPEIGL
jgi:putative nucleotidyltransferase with HDIG domain